MIAETYFDARLIDVIESSYARVLVLEYQGQRLELPTLHRREDLAGPHPFLTIGQIGSAHLVGAADWESADQVGRFYRFNAYHDQSLRRAIELDATEPLAGTDGRVPNVIGWRCASKPDGFRAPIGLIPGAHGNFYTDCSISLTLRIPHEFSDVCARYGLTAETVLRGFIADAAGLMNYFAEPRADGYSSNGSDERAYAEQWLSRAYGHLYADAELKRAVNEAIEAEAEEEAIERDDLDLVIDEYREHGGSLAELRAHVRTLIEAKGQP